MIIKKFFEELTFLGGILFYIIFSLYFLFNKEYIFLTQLVAGLVIIYAVTLLIRLFYFKPRPKKIKHNNFIEKIDASSFPSIHTARTTFLFIFLVFNFLNNLWILSLILILSFLVIYSRIYLKKHDWVDVVGGIMLGIVSFILAFLFR